ncbi:MAG: phage regulatory CII family protein [Candidatus Sedimenticola sp. (ex Thyasira tokunagai)]
MSYIKETTALERAAHSLVLGFEHDGKRGAQAMGPFLGKTPASVSNEVNPNYDGAKLGLLDAVLMEMAAQQYPLLHEHARMTHHVCLPLPDPKLITGDASLFESFVAWQGAQGITCQHIHDAFNPNGPGGAGVIAAEGEAIAIAGYHQMSLFLGFLAKIRQLSEPAHH